MGQQAQQPAWGGSQQAGPPPGMQPHVGGPGMRPMGYPGPRHGNMMQQGLRPDMFNGPGPQPVGIISCHCPQHYCPDSGGLRFPADTCITAVQWRRDTSNRLGLVDLWEAHSLLAWAWLSHHYGLSSNRSWANHLPCTSLDLPPCSLRRRFRPRRRSSLQPSLAGLSTLRQTAGSISTMPLPSSPPGPNQQSCSRCVGCITP